MIAAPVASERSNGHLPDMRHPGLRHEAVVEMKAILLAPLPIVRRRFGCARMQRMPRAHDAELVQEPLLEHAMSSPPRLVEPRVAVEVAGDDSWLVFVQRGYDRIETVPGRVNVVGRALRPYRQQV